MILRFRSGSVTPRSRSRKRAELLYKGHLAFQKLKINGCALFDLADEVGLEYLDVLACDALLREMATQLDLATRELLHGLAAGDTSGPVF